MAERDHTTPTNVRLPAALHRALEAEAERRGLRRSHALRLLLAEALGDPELARLPEASEAASTLRNGA